MIVFCSNEEEYLNVMVMVGKNRVKIRVDKDSEELRWEESNYLTAENAFFKWKNVWSEEPGDVYSTVFNHL